MQRTHNKKIFVLVIQERPLLVFFLTIVLVAMGPYLNCNGIWCFCEYNFENSGVQVWSGTQDNVNYLNLTLRFVPFTLVNLL